MYCVWYDIVIDQYGTFVFMHIFALWGLQTGAETIKVWWLSLPQRNWLSNDMILQLWIFTAFGMGGRKWVTKPSHWSQVKSRIATWLSWAQLDLTITVSVTWLWLELICLMTWLDINGRVDLKWVFYCHRHNLQWMTCMAQNKNQVIMRGVPVFWELWRNHVVNCEEMELCNILKLKNNEPKFFANNDS